MRAQVSQARLRELLHYDEISGRFVRRVGVKGSASGVQVGSTSTLKHCRYVVVDGRKYKEHHLVWLYRFGTFPTKCIDHINGDPLDNRIENLREATLAENAQNVAMHRDNTSGYLGVSFDRPRNKFQARLCVDGKVVFRGRFDTAEEAHEAYKAAKRRFHTFSPEIRGCCGN